MPMKQSLSPKQFLAILVMVLKSVALTITALWKQARQLILSFSTRIFSLFLITSFKLFGLKKPGWLGKRFLKIKYLTLKKAGICSWPFGFGTCWSSRQHILNVLRPSFLELANSFLGASRLRQEKLLAFRKLCGAKAL